MFSTKFSISFVFACFFFFVIFERNKKKPLASTTPMEAVRKLRGGGGGDDDETFADTTQQGGASPSPSRQAREFLPDSLPEDRLYYWQRMSSIVRIQKWWKQIFARRLIHERAVQRRRELAEMLEGECAATIQFAWRRFHASKIETE